MTPSNQCLLRKIGSQRLKESNGQSAIEENVNLRMFVYLLLLAILISLYRDDFSLLDICSLQRQGLFTKAQRILLIMSNAFFVEKNWMGGTQVMIQCKSIRLSFSNCKLFLKQSSFFHSKYRIQINIRLYSLQRSLLL